MIGPGHFVRSLLVLLLLACAIQAAPAVAENACAGGDRPRPDDGGIGGTGARPPGPEEDEGGIGGTGVVAEGDTGIIGTITGFASICVGDLEIRYGADSAVLIDGVPARIENLDVGQVVEVVASGNGSELVARQISVRHVLAGPVTRSDRELNQIEVMGQTVQLTSSTRSGGGSVEQALAGDIAPGAVVEISGLRRADGVVVASLVNRDAATTRARVAGTVTRADPLRLEVDGTEVALETGASVAVGDEVRIAGRWDGAKLVASAVEAVPRVPFDGRVARVEIEGYSNPRATGGLQVGGFVFEPSSPEVLPVLDPDAPVRVEGFVRDRRLLVERIRTGGPPSERQSPPDIWNRGAGSGPKEGRPPDERGGAPRRDSDAPRPPRGSDFGGPQRMDRPGRPDTAPDRPPHFERPPLADRPRPPDRPQRPERPERPNVRPRP